MSQYSLYKVKKSICFFLDKKHFGNYGYCTLSESPDRTVIQMNLKNMPPGQHGFHVHEFADPRNDFKNLGSHYNPYNNEHGGLNQKNNHVGDLGNIIVNADGTCNQTINVDYLPLEGPDSVMGRSMVIHAMVDDMGVKNTHDSRTSGSSGEKLYYGVIGHAKN